MVSPAGHGALSPGVLVRQSRKGCRGVLKFQGLAVATASPAVAAARTRCEPDGGGGGSRWRSHRRRQRRQRPSPGRTPPPPTRGTSTSCSSSTIRRRWRPRRPRCARALGANVGAACPTGRSSQPARRGRFVGHGRRRWQHFRLRGSGKGGVFQYTPAEPAPARASRPARRSSRTSAATKNYTGDLEDVFGCISALGESGCGFEHQFAAITRALGADGRAAPAEKACFLRQDALPRGHHAHERGRLLGRRTACRFDTSQSDPGQPARAAVNFRCNEFGHMCDGGAPSRNSPNGMVTARVLSELRVCRRLGLLKTWATRRRR